MRTVSLMGSSGSVGLQALDVVRAEGDRFGVYALGVQRSTATLVAQAAEFHPAIVVVGDPSQAHAVRAAVPAGTDVLVGPEGMAEAARGADVVLNAVVGFAGLPVTLAALEAGRRLALANKESLIAGAPVVQKARRTPGAEIVPVDSEHCALHQCLASVDGTSAVARLLLTASGGPFRGLPAEQLGAVTVEDALAHPTWSMGPKITVDSSTLMNKGLEVIEAHELFGVDYDRIEVVVHPQSVVHSMVELRDGSTLAQLSDPDMRLPIGYALGLARPGGHRLRVARLEPAPGADLRAPGPRRLPMSRPGLRGGTARGIRPGLAQRGERGRGGGLPGPPRCRGTASPTWWPRRSRHGATTRSTRSTRSWPRTPRPGSGPGPCWRDVRRSG